jgi:hypothetical protein
MNAKIVTVLTAVEIGQAAHSPQVAAEELKVRWKKFACTH